MANFFNRVVREPNWLFNVKAAVVTFKSKNINKGFS